MVEDEFKLGYMRPDDPDFWKLSEMILALTSRLDEGEDPDQIIMGELIKYIDDYTISYMAMQRAMRYALEEGAAGELEEKREDVTYAASIWLEGFLMGARFQESKEESDE